MLISAKVKCWALQNVTTIWRVTFCLGQICLIWIQAIPGYAFIALFWVLFAFSLASELNLDSEPKRSSGEYFYRGVKHGASISIPVAIGVGVWLIHVEWVATAVVLLMYLMQATYISILKGGGSGKVLKS